MSEWVWMRKTFLFSAAEEKGGDFVSVTSNWVKRACFYMSKYLVAHKPEYSQRSCVRQSKQDGPFLLITVLIVIDLLYFLQTEVLEYFYHFAAKELRSSDSSGSAEAIRWFSFHRRRLALGSVHMCWGGEINSGSHSRSSFSWCTSSYSIMKKESGQFGWGCGAN